MTFLERVRGRLASYVPYYEAPEGEFLRLDQNTNLLGTNPATRTLGDDATNLHEYPSRDNTPLIKAAADTYRVDADQVWAGNGSDEILDNILRVLVPPGGVVAGVRPSYALYPHLCRLNRVEYRQVPLGDDYAFPGRELRALDPDLVLLATPNNPTGTTYPIADLVDFAEGFDGPVVVDEAYAEYAGASILEELEACPNLVVVRTLSKAYGLAGLRVGFGIAAAEVAGLVRRAKAPFTVGLVAERVAMRALQDRAFVEDAVRENTTRRAALSTGLRRLGFVPIASQANFVLALSPIPPATLAADLRRHGILVRTFAHEPSLAGHVRFTVGTAEMVARLLEALRLLLAEAPA